MRAKRILILSAAAFFAAVFVAGVLLREPQKINLHFAFLEGRRPTSELKTEFGWGMQRKPRSGEESPELGPASYSRSLVYYFKADYPSLLKAAQVEIASRGGTELKGFGGDSGDEAWKMPDGVMVIVSRIPLTPGEAGRGRPNVYVLLNGYAEENRLGVLWRGIRKLVSRNP
jgi:hypothetical protein